MIEALDPIDRSLLDDFQRDFPLVPAPFAVLANRTGISEAEVLQRLRALVEAGRVARVGATVRPNTAGASTLAAMQVPEDRIEAVAAQINRFSGVNHSYLREHDWNLWFVLTAPDPEHLSSDLDRIRSLTGLALMDLRLVRPFNIDLGFPLSGERQRMLSRDHIEGHALRETDRALLHALSQGLSLVSRPWAATARTIGWSEAQVLARTRSLYEAGILTRIGIIVRHRAIGWTSNAMVVWNLPDDRMDAAGRALSAVPGVTLCYQRRTVPGVWDYGLYSMIHARSRTEAEKVLARASALPELAGITPLALFSVRCFKQTGARLSATSKELA